jgi:cytochrome c556
MADEEIAEYREEVMEAIGGHTGALAKIIGGKVAFSQDAKSHVLALASLAPMVSAIFPPGSVTRDSHALPAIWEKPADFQKAVANFQTAVADLAKQADAPPKEMAPAFDAVAKACKNCHDNFRKKT